MTSVHNSNVPSATLLEQYLIDSEFPPFQGYIAHTKRKEAKSLPVAKRSC